MIFVTVGTTPFPFLRMAAVVQNIIDLRNEKEEILFQCGNTPCDFKYDNVTVRHNLSFNETQQYMKRARIVICHGGPATIYQAFSFGKIPYVIPRKRQYGEHVNDHQVYFCQDLDGKGKIILLDQVNIKNILNKHQPYVKPYKNWSRNNMIRYLDQISI
jgi:UDP-N-acetylglucosamine transferase subunit ALG13